MPQLLLRAARTLFIAALPGAAASAAHALTVDVTPKGEVVSVRQIVATFSDDVARFGDPSGEPRPFTVACAPKAAQGQGHWLDTRTWVFDFRRDLPAGLTCTLTPAPGLRSQAGAAYAGPASLGFFTGGPAVLDSNPYRWSVPEDAAFILKLSSDYDPASLERHAWIEAPGVASRIGVEVLTGAAREALLAVDYRYEQAPTPEELAKVVILRPRTLLPAGRTVKLVLGPGVATRAGVARRTRQVWDYEVRPAFTATFECERENAKAACIPFTAMRVRLSGPVARSVLKGVRLTGPGGKPWTPKFHDDEEEGSEGGEGSGEGGGDSVSHYVEFPGPFPQNASFKLTLPAGFKDDSGRALVNAASFPLTVRTAGYPPLAKFPAPFGIIEAAAGEPTLPVTLRSVEAEVAAKVYAPVVTEGEKGVFVRLIDRLKSLVFRLPRNDLGAVLAWLDRVTGADREASVFTAKGETKPFEQLALVDPKRAQALRNDKIARTDAKRFEVLGLPLPGPGFYVVELESRILGQALLDKPAPMYVPTAALVTNLAVHFKRGRDNALVWVTTLDRASPVKGALVSIWDCTGKMHWKGRTERDGIARVDAELPAQDAASCRDGGSTPYSSGLLVVAESDGDFSFAHTSWNDGIEPWRYDLPYAWERDDLAAHTIFDRTLFRAGETVHMKTLLRRRTLDGFGAVPADARPSKLVLQHEGSDQKVTLDLAWDDAGTAATEWAIPKAASLGTYRVYLLKGAEDTWENQLTSGEFRVEEFRIPLTRAQIAAESQRLVAPKSVAYDLAVQYLSGGAASHLPARFRARLVEPGTPARFTGFEDFAFGTPPLTPGLKPRDTQRAPARELHAAELTLDQGGSARVTVGSVPASGYPVRLEAELEYKDPNGEIQTVASGQTVWPADVVVGIRPASWALAKEDIQLVAAAVTPDGKPAPDTKITVRAFKRDVLTHRKRLIGGFYAYDNQERIKALGVFCEGATGPDGRFACKGKVKASGQVYLQAEAKDAAGRIATGADSVWVGGGGRWSFAQQDTDRMDLVPEKRAYEVGDTARLQVRMPFKEAVALVTVEREGVLDARVEAVKGDSPVIELPIRAPYAPNAYVSVLAVRGRSGKTQPGATVDLGKPAFRLGLAALEVGSKPYRLDVDVTTDRKVYQARDEVVARIHARAADGTPLARAEAAVAVVDQGLLELKPNESWSLLKSMVGQRPTHVHTFTSVMQVVGKRHFGLKAQAEGGGGGLEVTRSLFDPLVHWASRVQLGDDGKGEVRFKLNDSLTAFAVVAIAQAGTSRFGTGQTSIEATKDVMVLPGLPPVARAGDELRATFTVRNTTKAARKLTVTLAADGLAAQPKPRTVDLAARASKELSWSLRLPRAPGDVRWSLDVKEGTRTLDRVVVTQTLVAPLPVRSLQATLMQLSPGEAGKPLPIEAPAGALPGLGGLRLTLQPTLVAALAPLEAYMRDYPYTCLEQKLSRAVALGDDEAWRQAIAGLASYVDGDGLLKYYPQSEAGSTTLTAYVLTLAQETGWPLSEELRESLLNGLRGFVSGQVVRRSVVPGPDLPLRKLEALEALSRHDGSGVAEALSAMTVEPQELPTSALLDWLALHARLKDLPDAAAHRDRALGLLRARLTYRGTELAFSTEKADSLWWLMVSPDVNAVRLVLHALSLDLGKAFAGDELGKVVKGALARQGRKGYWDLTTANALGALALRKFAQSREDGAVAGSTTLTAGASAALDWEKAPKGGTIELPWPAGKATASVAHTGRGKPWALLEARAAVPLAAPVTRGFAVERTVTAVRRKHPSRWHVGDVMRIKLTVDAQSDAGFVVVDDPVPSGASILGRGLGRDAASATEDESSTGYAWPVYRESTFTALRAYYDYVDKGVFSLEYTVRLNNAGTFALPPTRVEAMYSPDNHGELPNSPLVVLE